MKLKNKKVEQLIFERNSIIKEYNKLIQSELDKEKINRKFDYKFFIFTIILVLSMSIAVIINKKIFPTNSIWSWNYYFNKIK